MIYFPLEENTSLKFKGQDFFLMYNLIGLIHWVFNQSNFLKLDKI